jgi:hypothetical protein
MKSSSSELLRLLVAASAKVQEAHGVARSANRIDVAAECLRTAEAISKLIGRLVTERQPVVEVVS